MDHIETAIEDHLTRFAALLDHAFQLYGAADGLPATIAHAVRVTPRHHFVHRFRTEENGPLHDADAEPLRHLSTIYSDAPQFPADAAGNALPSSNSQSSYVLWLVDALGLQHAHRVLEIGSGSGWLAAIMARLVGAEGHVTGVEIIAELAGRSRQDLEALGIGNVEIVTGDGEQGYAEAAPYDRAIITAAVWDVPLPLFTQIADGGRIVIPIAQAGGSGCHVSVLRRDGDRFVAERIVQGYFVPFVGSGQTGTANMQLRRDARLIAADKESLRDACLIATDKEFPCDACLITANKQLALDDLPFWAEIGAVPALRHAFWLGGDGECFGPAAIPFRTFLSVTERNFTVFEKGLVGPERCRAAFGLFNADPPALALCRPGELLSYGAPGAAQRLAAAYARWADLGMPGVGAFDLEVVLAEAAPEPSDGIWVDRRGHTAMVWRLKSVGESWKALTGEAAG